MTNTYIISGAGSGIGRAITQKLANDGHNCVLLGRNADKLQETLSTLPKGEHLILIADIGNKESLGNALKQLGYSGKRPCSQLWHWRRKLLGQR